MVAKLDEVIHVAPILDKAAAQPRLTKLPSCDTMHSPWQDSEGTAPAPN